MGKGEIALVLGLLGAAAVGVYLLAKGKLKLPKLDLFGGTTEIITEVVKTAAAPPLKIIIGLEGLTQMPLGGPPPSWWDFFFGKPFVPPTVTEPTVTVAPPGTVPLFPPEITGEPVQAVLTTEIIVDVSGQQWQVALVNGQPIGVPLT